MQKQLKLSLIGYGKMGKMIERIALDEGHEVVSIIDPVGGEKNINETTIGDADVCIDFTHPSCVVNNIEKVMALGKNMVVGTTGWEKHLEKVQQLVKENGTGFFYASNFSMGMHLFKKIVAEAAALIMSTNQYDIAGLEAHHNQKADAPSGTAITLAEAIAQRIQCSANKIPFSSLRCGSIPGTHTILFDSVVDSITLTHQARSREGWAQGAVTAAKWLQGRSGFFSMDDLMKM